MVERRESLPLFFSSSVLFFSILKSWYLIFLFLCFHTWGIYVCSLRNAGAETSDTSDIDSEDEQRQRMHRQRYSTDENGGSSSSKSKKKLKKTKKKKTFMKRLSNKMDRFASESSASGTAGDNNSGGGGGGGGGSSTDLAPRPPRRLDNAPVQPMRRQQQRISYAVDADENNDDDNDVGMDNEERQRDDDDESAPIFSSSTSSPMTLDVSTTSRQDEVDGRYEDDDDDDNSYYVDTHTGMNNEFQNIDIRNNNGRDSALLSPKSRRPKRSSMEHVTHAIGVLAKQPVKLAKQPVKLAKSTTKRFRSNSKSPMSKRKSRNFLGGSNHGSDREDTNKQAKNAVQIVPPPPPPPPPIYLSDEDYGNDDEIANPPPRPPARQVSDDLESDNDDAIDPFTDAQDGQNALNNTSDTVYADDVTGTSSPIRGEYGPAAVASTSNASPVVHSPRRFSLGMRPPTRFSTSRSSHDTTPVRPPRRLRKSYPESSPKKSDPSTPTRSRRSSMEHVTHAIGVLAKQPYKLAKQPVKLAKSTHKHIRRRVEDRRASNARGLDMDSDDDDNWIENQQSRPSKRGHRRWTDKKDDSSDDDEAIIVHDGSGEFVLPTPPVYQPESEDEFDIDAPARLNAVPGDNGSVHSKGGSSRSSRSSVIAKQRRRRSMYHVATAIGNLAKQPVKLAKQPVKLAKSTTKRIRKAANRSRNSTIEKDIVQPPDEGCADDADPYSIQHKFTTKPTKRTGGDEGYPISVDGLVDPKEDIGSGIDFTTSQNDVRKSTYHQNHPSDEGLSFESFDDGSGHERHGFRVVENSRQQSDIPSLSLSDPVSVDNIATGHTKPDSHLPEESETDCTNVDAVRDHRVDEYGPAPIDDEEMYGKEEPTKFVRDEEIVIPGEKTSMDFDAYNNIRTSNNDLVSPQAPTRRLSNEIENTDDAAGLYEYADADEYMLGYNDEHHGSLTNINDTRNGVVDINPYWQSPKMPKRRLSNDNDNVDGSSTTSNEDDSVDETGGDFNRSRNLERGISGILSSPKIPERRLSDASTNSMNSSGMSSASDDEPTKERCNSCDELMLRTSHSADPTPTSRFDQVFEKKDIQRHSSMPMNQISRVSMTGEVVYMSSSKQPRAITCSGDA